MPTWPASLPQQPLIKTYTEAPDSNVVSSSMDVGPSKTRLRSTATTIKAQVQYQLTTAQRSTFEAWFRNDIAYGALPFSWPRPRMGVAEVLIKGESPYSLETLGKGYLLSMTLEIQP